VCTFIIKICLNSNTELQKYFPTTSSEQYLAQFVSEFRRDNTTSMSVRIEENIVQILSIKLNYKIHFLMPILTVQ
jgi:uncharacterized protein YsxB (DUF464 family)